MDDGRPELGGWAPSSLRRVKLSVVEAQTRGKFCSIYLHYSLVGFFHLLIHSFLFILIVSFVNFCSPFLYCMCHFLYFFDLFGFNFLKLDDSSHEFTLSFLTTLGCPLHSIQPFIKKQFNAQRLLSQTEPPGEDLFDHVYLEYYQNKCLRR